MKALAALAVAFCCGQPAAAAAASAAPPEVPVVVVPGVTGTRLEDPRDGRATWGDGAHFLRPRDGGYAVALPLDSDSHPQALYEPVEPLWELRIPAWTKPIYRPLATFLVDAGYRLGRLEKPVEEATLFFFNYDWRRGNLDSVGRLAGQLAELARVRAAAGRGSELDLVCQSNAARICRYLAKYGALSPAQAESGAEPDRPYSIRKIVLVGASNDGSVRALQLLHQGRSYVPLVGRRFHPELFFTLRTLFEDLPADSESLFVDARGRPLDVDLYDPANWERYGWSIFDPRARRRVKAAGREDLFGDPALWIDYLAERLATARRLHRLLAADAPHFSAIRYYRIENGSAPTMRGVLLAFSGGEWETFFPIDRRVARDSSLEAATTAPGDGHATLESQRRLSPQEEEAHVASHVAKGGHFEMVIAPESLAALLSFLAE